MLNVGILTYHRAINYGAYLQACALCARLNQEGINTEIIDYRMEREAQHYSDKNKSVLKTIFRYRAYKFKRELKNAFLRGYADDIFNVSDIQLVSDNINDFICAFRGKYDLIIVGSDEVWKLDGFRGFPTPYWLMGDLNCKKMSYAASSRSDFDFFVEKEMLQKILNDFVYIGVRDRLTYNSIVKFVVDAEKLHLCCDPSFIFDYSIKHDKLENLLRDKGKLKSNKKDIVVMTEDAYIAKTIKKRLGNKYNLISVFRWHKGYINVSDLAPREWLEVVANADYVIASYFHAICFSIMKKRPFIALGTAEKSSKLKALLEKTELEKYYIADARTTLKNLDIIKLLEEQRDECIYNNFIKLQNANVNDFVKAVRACVKK